jgi:hypothetical protein
MRQRREPAHSARRRAGTGVLKEDGPPSASPVRPQLVVPESHLTTRCGACAPRGRPPRVEVRNLPQRLGKRTPGVRAAPRGATAQARPGPPAPARGTLRGATLGHRAVAHRSHVHPPAGCAGRNSSIELPFEQYTRYLDHVSPLLQIHSNVCLAQPFETHYRCTNCPCRHRADRSPCGGEHLERGRRDHRRRECDRHIDRP